MFICPQNLNLGSNIMSSVSNGVIGLLSVTDTAFKYKHELAKIQLYRHAQDYLIDGEV